MPPTTLALLHLGDGCHRSRRRTNRSLELIQDRSRQVIRQIRSHPACEGRIFDGDDVRRSGRRTHHVQAAEYEGAVFADGAAEGATELVVGKRGDVPVQWILIVLELGASSQVVVFELFESRTVELVGS